MPSNSLAPHADGQRLPDIPLRMAHSHLKLNTSKTNPSPSLRTRSFPLSHSTAPGDSALEPQSYLGAVLACHPSSQVPGLKTRPVGWQTCLPLFFFTQALGMRLPLPVIWVIERALFPLSYQACACL